LRNGIKEIEQNLSEGLIKSHAFATRGSKNEISSFHYSHREKDAVYDIFTYFETEKTVRIRFEIKDNRDKSIPATICVYKSGVSLKNVSASEGNFEMSSLEKGDYVFNIEHKDVLDPFAKPKSVELTITLN
jgi:hypothetical protein